MLVGRLVGVHAQAVAVVVEGLVRMQGIIISPLGSTCGGWCGWKNIKARTPTTASDAAEILIKSSNCKIPSPFI